MNIKLIVILMLPIISFGCAGFNVGGTFTYNLITCEEKPVQIDSPLPITPEVIGFSPQYGGGIVAGLGLFFEMATFPVTLPLGVLGGSVWGLISIPETKVLKVARNPKTSKQKLTELAKDPRENVRIEVAWNENTPIDVAIALAKEPNDALRKYATLALGGRYGYESTEQALSAVFENLEATPKGDTEKAITALIENLSDPNPEVRYAATKALREYGSLAKVALPALTKALDDSEIPVRIGAIETIGQMGYVARKTVPDLERMLGDENPQIRDTAVKAIERIGGKIDEEEQ